LPNNRENLRWRRLARRTIAGWLSLPGKCPSGSSGRRRRLAAEPSWPRGRGRGGGRCAGTGRVGRKRAPLICFGYFLGWMTSRSWPLNFQPEMGHASSSKRSGDLGFSTSCVCVYVRLVYCTSQLNQKTR
jgi:hypothetical protein